MIYFDNAANTMHKPETVIHAVAQALNSLGNAGRGAHEASLDASRNIYGVRERIADFFHGEDPSRIAFTSNSTESLNTAVKGILKPGDHVVTTVLEHNSVLRPLYEMEEKRVEVTILPCPIRHITSDSAKTVHMELIFTFFPFRASSQRASGLTAMVFAMTSRKRPVPAEHLSFMAKSFTIPFSRI